MQAARRIAAQALEAVGSEQAAPVTSYLLQQQCEEGYFRLPLTADAAAEDQTCDGAEGQPSVDTTALVLNQLLEIDGGAWQQPAPAIDAIGGLVGGQALLWFKHPYEHCEGC